MLPVRDKAPPHPTVRRAELFKELEAAVADAHGEQARRSGALDGRGARALGGENSHRGIVGEES